jgi:hypothetical protein
MLKRDGCIEARQEAIANFDWPSNSQTTTTITIASIIKVSPTIHIAPRSPQVLGVPRSNISTRRFIAPLSWANFKRWLVNTSTPPKLTSSSSPTVTPFHATRASGPLIHRAIANAATTRTATLSSWSWPHHQSKRALPLNCRPRIANRTCTYWEAYSTLQLQASQLCFAKATYLDKQRTPSSARSSADDEVAAELDKVVCTGEKAKWVKLAQGGRCEGKKE